MLLEGKVIASTSCSGQTSDTISLHTRCTHISMIPQKYFFILPEQWVFQEGLGLAGIVIGTQVSLRAEATPRKYLSTVLVSLPTLEQMVIGEDLRSWTRVD